MRERKVIVTKTATAVGRTEPLQQTARRHRPPAAVATPEVDRPRLQARVSTAAIFESAAWQARWRAIRPNLNSTSAYIAGCRGTMALGERLGVPVYKPGTTTQDIAKRMAKLNGERHGSSMIRNLTLVDEPGWTDWAARKIGACPTHPASPVRVLPRSLAIDFPGWVSPARIEALVVAALQPVSPAYLAATPRGRALAKRRGCHSDDLVRFTSGTRGPVLSTEISIIAPSGDAAALVTTIERLVIDLVLADDDGRER